MSQTATATDVITVYSTTWCPDCHRAKAFLNSKGVEYREVDIEAQPEAAETVAAHNNGKHIVPTFDIGGRFYGNPSLHELGQLVAR
ncbi:MAG: glutaredoxin family protein [Acidobacteriota bacterium]